MAFTSRKLIPQTLTYSSSSYYYSYSTSPSPSPSPAPSPSPSPSDAKVCLVSCDPPCPFYYNCHGPYFSPPPPSFLPPPYNPSPGRSLRLSTPGIITVSLISSLFLLTVYLILLARSRRNRPNNRGLHQGPMPPPGGGGQGGEEEEEEWNQNQAMVHPIWLINTVGLQPAVISSIAVCEYKKGEGLIEGNYCSICLSEFEEGENLRLLPKCSHAFHIPCIDTWLRLHTNCPLCRSPILSPVPASGSIAVLEPAGSGSGGGEDVGENTEGGDTAVDDTGDSSGVAEGGNGDEGLNDKSDAEEVEVGASVGRRSVSIDGNATILVNMDGEGNRRGRVGRVRSLPGSGRFCRLGRDS